ncbi:hypothetical protein HN51_005731 [Arachis hypogaea]|uniref:KIB1-4 beta-propeller domain-containing protein n=1 Tax=Arachis hypogaea TaxID=3818 RepID=A0A445DDI5_ARAHY|nr:uncharacterized protein LOC112795238 [Arachis hypogaea]QHO39534.1 uncharacterized protein DS421_4g129960 [Arachis hypogaea]RYR61226.1 hypothetical protein Ahy_A04g018366 [Arachis hypogaea]
MGEVDRWSNIHQDLLNEVTKRFYSYDNDYLQLRLVCKQWNLKLPKIPTGNKVPWLLLPISGGAAKESFEAVRSLEEEDIYHIMQLPTIDEATLDTDGLEEEEIYHFMLWELQDNSICGSCHGWLIIVMVYEGTIKMLNPFTKVHLDLPPISTLSNVIDINGKECIKIPMHKTQIWKAIINSAPTNDNNNDFMAVVIYGCKSNLAFYKPNDKRWLRFSTRPMCDVIFFQEKIYAVDYEGQLYEFDTKNKSGPMGRIYEATPPPSDKGIFKCYYLIGCANGSLLMLIRPVTRRYKVVETVKFYVYELKKNEKAWSRIYDLGNYILVIGLNSSVQMLSSKGNQIYFTDNMRIAHSPYLAELHDVGIFNLEDGSFKKLLTDVKFFCPPVWILS